MRTNAVQVLIRAVTPLTLLGSLVPFIRTTSWWVRAWDFPRLQLACLAAGAAGMALRRRDRLTSVDRKLGAAAVGALLVQLANIYPYLPLAPVQVPRVRSPRKDSMLRLLTANVRMRNRDTAAVLGVIKEADPDLVFLLESNERWEQALAEIESSYPYTVKHPQPNTYGMHLYSRLPLVNPEVRFLVKRDVPSIRTRVRLRDGRLIWFYGVHPRPPVRANLEGDIELQGSCQRDAELAVVGMEISELLEPAIVAGDLNDVAWSHTTRRFQQVSKMVDPRVGRGFYNTYHARYPFFRFPLDHLFHTKDFSLVEFRRGDWIGSDHFPIYAVLALNRP